MAVQIIYLCNECDPDPVVLAALTGAVCDVERTATVGKSIEAFYRALAVWRADARTNGDRTEGVALVAEAQAGAAAVLELLREESVDRLLPAPVMIVDRHGSDISLAVRAIRHGVRTYVLANDPPSEVILQVQMFVERARLDMSARSARPQPAPVWNADWNSVNAGGKPVFFTPTESRIIQQLMARPNQAVTLNELALGVWPNMPTHTVAARLRPMVMRLRRKLDAYPGLANRLMSVRGVGYMLAIAAPSANDGAGNR